MSINFKETGQNNTGSFEPLPEGRYNVKVETTSLKTASTGNQMINAQFVVTDGEFKNRKLWNNFTITPKSLVFLYSFLKAAGSDLISEDNAGENEVANNMIGLAASAFVEPTVTNTGTPTNKLGKWAPALADGAVASSGSLFS